MKKQHFAKILVAGGMAGLALSMTPVQAATVQSSEAVAVVDPIPSLPAAWQYHTGWPAFSNYSIGHALIFGPIGGPYYWALNQGDLGPVLTARSEVPAKALD